MKGEQKMGIFDVLVAIILGIVEGITEWLPISSTGHMILVNQFLTFSNDEFTQMFLVVVQLGAIMAVVLLFWKKIFPFNFQYKQNNKPDFRYPNASQQQISWQPTASMQK